MFLPRSWSQSSSLTWPGSPLWCHDEVWERLHVLYCPTSRLLTCETYWYDGECQHSHVIAGTLFSIIWHIVAWARHNNGPDQDINWIFAPDISDLPAIIKISNWVTSLAHSLTTSWSQTPAGHRRGEIETLWIRTEQDNCTFELFCTDKTHLHILLPCHKTKNMKHK